MMRIFIIQVHDPVIHLEVDECYTWYLITYTVFVWILLTTDTNSTYCIVAILPVVTKDISISLPGSRLRMFIAMQP